MSSEQYIIGRMMTSRQHLAEAIAFIDNKPDFFTDPAHQRIYESAALMFGKHQVVDLTTLMVQIKKHNAFEKSDIDKLMAAEAAGWKTQTILDHLVNHMEGFLTKKLLALTHEINTDLQKPKMNSLQVMDKLQTQIAEIDAMLTANQIPTIGRIAGQVISLMIDKREGRAIAGISTGFDNLNKKLGYLMPGSLNILAARPAMGKTAFAVTLALNIAKAGKRVLFMSLEMSGEELVARSLSQMAEVHNCTILKTPKDLDEAQFNRVLSASDEIVKLPLTIVDDGEVKINKLKSFIQRVQPEIVFVDYLQIMTPSVKEHISNQTQFYEDLTRDLKIIAKQQRLPMVVLSQLNRANEARANKRPMMSDLRSSGGIEQNADTVTFLHRPKYYDNSIDDDTTEVIIAKNRNGLVGTCLFKFIDIYTKFADADGMTYNNQNSFYDNGVPF
jgi:replicative DNA helicase